MTVRELIKSLLDFDLDSIAYVGKGCGPVESLHPTAANGGQRVVVIKP